MRGRLKKTWAVATLGVVLFLVASFEQSLGFELLKQDLKQLHLGFTSQQAGPKLAQH